MKKTILSILNKPFLVIVVSVVIAVAVGTIFYIQNSAAPAYQFVVAGPGSISMQSDASATSSVQHLTLGFLSTGRVQKVNVQVGDTVHKDDVLASLDPENTAGAITQAKASYDAAVANYQKVVNGATGPTIDVSKASVATAQTNLDQVTQQQDTLVANARRKLYSDDLVAENDEQTRRDIAPVITGVYNGDTSGDYKLSFNDFNDFRANVITYNGLEQGTAAKNLAPQPLGTRGLQIAFANLAYDVNDTWTIHIPNTNGANYTANLNAYQGALRTHDQAIAAAQAALDQAEANLSLTAAQARPEDVAAAQAQVENTQGALQMAQSSYDSKVIRSPGEGTVTAVHVSAGEIAGANAPAIELSGTSFAKAAALVVPKSAITTRDGKTYVLVQVDGKTQEREITVGAEDDTNAEVLSGLAVGDSVATQ